LLTGAVVAAAAVMVGEAAGTDLAGEAEDTLLAGEVVTDSVVVTHLADSPAVALVRGSAGCGGFLLVDFLVVETMGASVIVETMAASVIVVSMGEIGTFTVVGFTILMEALSILASPTLDIQITPTTHIRTTTAMGI
jgi:hypothetical protein